MTHNRRGSVGEVEGKAGAEAGEEGEEGEGGESVEEAPPHLAARASATWASVSLLRASQTC